MTDIRVPKLNANDATYILVEWLAEDGQRVQAGEAVAVLETSKATAEIECEEGGVLHRVLAVGAECLVGQAIGYLFPSEEERQRFLASHHTQAGAAEEDSADLVVTSPARELLDELGLGLAQLRALGKKVIRRADVERLAASGGAEQVRVLPAVQRAIAATVERSHRDIPAAFAAVKVQVEDALGLAHHLTREARMLIGLPELVIKAVASLHEQFPLFFATPLDGCAVRLSEAPNVGVTIDVGKGLYIPVVRDAGQLSVQQIAHVLMGFRLTALRGTYRERDLAGANITVTLHTDDDVVFATPLIHPGQTCALSLAGTHNELVLNSERALTTHTATYLGLAYDHRIINGRDAVRFLQAVKAALESPQRLAVENPRPDTSRSKGG